MPAKRNHIRVFVASTVYNFQYQLDQIYQLLDNYGYDVFMSHKGTIALDSKKSNLENCTNGVQECDVFIGFIRPDYGSGVLTEGGLSITHQEFQTAMSRDIPRFVLADSKVVFSRQLLRQTSIIEAGKTERLDLSKVSFKKDGVMDIRCIGLYDEAIQSETPLASRIGNWVQEYVDINDIKLHLDSQFKYPERIKKLINDSKTKV